MHILRSRALRSVAWWGEDSELMGRSFFPWGSSLALWPVFLRVTGATPLHPANPVLSMTDPVLMTENKVEGLVVLSNCV